MNKKYDIGDSNARQNEYMREHQDEPNVSGPCINDVWNLTAVRSYFRLLSIRTDGWDEMEGCDAHYDGGEWSGPAWAKNWEEVQQRTLDYVGHRFGVDANDLYDWIEYYYHEEARTEQEAMMAKGDDQIRTMCGFDPAHEEL